jgi:hypothetical protein
LSWILDDQAERWKKSQEKLTPVTYQDILAVGIPGAKESNVASLVASGGSTPLRVSDTFDIDGPGGQDATPHQPAGGTATLAGTVTSTAAGPSWESHNTMLPPMSTSTGQVTLDSISTNLQPTFVEHEVNSKPPPSYPATPGPTDPPDVSHTAATYVRSRSPSAAMDISPPPDLRLNGHPPIRRKRRRSPSTHAESSHAEPRSDSSRVPLDTVMNETTYPVKQESISETDVLQFLDTIPLGSAALHDGFPRIIPAPPRKPRKVEFGPEMAVVAARRGSPSKATLTIKCSVDEHQMSLISLWVNRDKKPEYVNLASVSAAC